MVLTPLHGRAAPSRSASRGGIHRADRVLDRHRCARKVPQAASPPALPVQRQRLPLDPGLVDVKEGAHAGVLAARSLQAGTRHVVLREAALEHRMGESVNGHLEDVGRRRHGANLRTQGPRGQPRLSLPSHGTCHIVTHHPSTHVPPTSPVHCSSSGKTVP